VGDPDLEGRLVVAIADALAREFPRKPEAQRARRAAEIAQNVRAVWPAYFAGATAALLDLVSFYGAVGAPLPPEETEEVWRLCSIALANVPNSAGQGADTQLKAHRACLIKRLRWHAVNAILDDAGEYADADRAAVAEWGADPALYAQWARERPEASAEVRRACELARLRLEHVAVQWRAIEMAWREVEQFAAAARTFPPAWPGKFYVPTLATMERLGWEDLTVLATEYGQSDFPELGIV